MLFQDKLDAIINKNNSLLCVGLDSDATKLPDAVKHHENPQFEFNKAIIDATNDLVCGYKPNSAFYEAEGTEGVKQLKMTFDYIREVYPEVVLILDAKRADIGSTNDGYVKYAFDWLGVDAMTVHPYLGREAVQPFLDQKDKGIIILCKTSNPGAGEFQDMQSTGKPLYQLVAEHVVKEWNENSNCLLVVGATYSEELAVVRGIVGDMALLVPGIGVQGGDVEKIVRAGLNTQKKGMIINSSRTIIFASHDVDFPQRAREQALALRDEINRYREKI